MPVAVAFFRLISGRCPRAHLGPRSRPGCSVCLVGSSNDSPYGAPLSRLGHLASGKEHKQHMLACTPQASLARVPN